MAKRRIARFVFILFIPVLFLVVVMATAAAASPRPSAKLPPVDDSALASSSAADQTLLQNRHKTPITVIREILGQLSPDGVELAPSTTLTVAIYSHPWAHLDSNDPTGISEAVPIVMVLQAVVTNTGGVTATNVAVNVDFNEDPDMNWRLLPGQALSQFTSKLAPSTGSTFYWFATYPVTRDLGHVYTMTASAGNADPVSTVDNAYGNPAPGETVRTRRALSTGNSGLSQSAADVTVGIAFTITAGYDLGTNPRKLTVSPIGNADFNAGAYRLLSSQLAIYDNGMTQELILTDQLYVPSLPAFADRLTATFTFVALAPDAVRLCPYAAIEFNQNVKYDTLYCSEVNAGSVITISGSSVLSLTLNKIGDSPTVLQNEEITYTLTYTNQGDLPLTNIWIWDEFDLDLASVITSSASPPADPSQTSASRVAWFFPEIPASGQLGSSGTLTFTALVDGNGQDLADQTALVNRGFYGIGISGFPTTVALTKTVTSTVLAPTLQLSKSNGLEVVDVGTPLSYTLLIANSGAISATDLLITDTLPAGVLYVDGAAGESSRNGQQLVWDSYGSLPPGDSIIISIPVTVDSAIADGTTLTNTMLVDHGNGAGHTYQRGRATDTTRAQRRAGWFQGTAFVDTNGDGQFDAGESPLAGITVTLSNAVTPQVTTGPTGTYWFQVELEKPVSLDTTLPAGYFRTTPGAVSAVNVFEITQTIDFGYAPDTAAFGVIHGTVYDDQNGNGRRDDGEPGAAGVTVTLDQNLNRLTDALGRYSFSTTVTGFHSVVETDPINTFSTTPNDIQVKVALNNDYEVDFGDAQITSNLSSVYGTVFDDLNGNGRRDAGESGLPNVLVTLDGAAAGTTDTYGSYTFVTTTVGTHQLVEEDPPGYFSTTSNEIHFVLGTSGSIQIDFGDAASSAAAFATIYGNVFEDTDTDTIWDVDELGIANVTVKLDSTETVTTDLFGNFTFITQLAGSHQVNQVDKLDYLSTTPNTVTLSVTLGQGHLVTFGDVWNGTPSCAPDSHEADDSANQAVALDPGTSQSHDFCDDANDWLKFEALAGTVYTITTSSWGQRADTFLALFDVDAQTMLAANDDFEGSTDHSSRIVWSAANAGTYYVRSSNRAGLTGSSTQFEVDLQGATTPPSTTSYLYLPIIFAGPAQNSQKLVGRSTVLGPLGVINHTCPDAYETDDHWQKAALLVSGVPQTHSFDSDPSRFAADKDYVWFDLPANATFTATVSNPINTSTLMELYDAAGNGLNMTGTSELILSDQPAGRYYLSVGPTTLTYGCSSEVGYTLEATVVVDEHMLFLPVIARGP